MRITGGKARGIILAVPEDTKFLRPATDFIREAVFSSLSSKIKQTTVLDLFAGVGSYGLEALSRGAEACIFVERNYPAVQAIETNIKNVKKSTDRNFLTKVFCQDVFSWAEHNSATFDVIFIDPPYNMVEAEGQRLLQTFHKFLKNSGDSRLIMEVPGQFKIGEIENFVELRRLGREGNSRQPNAIIYGKL